MVFMVDGVKYACASCIRGHRVKKCSHSNRPLIRIQKRGRQVSQCTHCRGLRKSNKSHIKCTCATNSTPPSHVNDCLCSVIPVCNCVACHLQDIKIEDINNTELKPTCYNNNNTTTNISPSPTPSPSVSSTKSLISRADLTHTVTTPLEEMNEYNTNLMHSPNEIYYTNSLFVKEDAELIDFLFNDLDKFLVPSPQLI